jgi:hypothetical protein
LASCTPSEYYLAAQLQGNLGLIFGGQKGINYYFLSFPKWLIIFEELLMFGVFDAVHPETYFLIL